MKIGVISDTHDRLPTFRRAVALCRRLQVGAIIHAGDYVAPFAAKLIAPQVMPLPVHCVYGNNDGERKGLKNILPQIHEGPLKIEIAGRKILVHHFIDWVPKADLVGMDVVITGHTHEVVEERRDGCLFLNPGECCGWVTDRCTMATLDLATLAVEIIEIHD